MEGDDEGFLICQQSLLPSVEKRITAWRQMAEGGQLETAHQIKSNVMRLGLAHNL